jgi:hypothetical protein
MENEDHDNGYEPEEALKLLGQLQTEGVSAMSVKQKMGVMQRLVTAVSKDEEYLQVLLNAAFENKAEALLCADAISERQRYGVNIRPLVNRVVAQCSADSARVNNLLQAMTHYTLNTSGKGKLPSWGKKQGIQEVSQGE